MKDFLGDAGGIPSARMSKVLEMARKAVINDGVSENHESFADLQILMAAHLLDSTGAIGGSVASRSVGDVSVSFARSAGESYKALYRTLKIKVTGISGRIA
jgi:hypothetical protein